MNIDKSKIEDAIRQVLPYPIFEEFNRQISLKVEKSKLIDILKLLRDNPETSFDMLTDITAIDWLEKENRFEIVYFLYSTKNKSRLLVKSETSEKDLNVPSAVGIWESANWYERETFDMYGIVFTNHPDLRRFYMPEDFNDPITGEALHPLRKDFPVMGVSDALPLPQFPERDNEN